MKPLTTSVYTFENLREGGFLYVDKTAQIFELISPSFSQYFLSRPRRFGKSLLISTLKSIFQGKRELFEGLAIDKLDYSWQKHPVIHLDLGASAAEDASELREQLIHLIERNATLLEVPLTQRTPSGAFLELVEKLADRDGKVVILVDEYDKPLLGHLGQPSAREIQQVLKGFYSVIKTTEAHQRFALLTGVSKFSRVSVFSDLNNLTDLTMHHRAATLLGYTQEELEYNFPEHIAALSNAIGMDYEDTLEELRVWYNGYRFHHAAPTVYNPVSVMKCFDELEFKNYWFETGTPSFLVNLLKQTPIELGDLTVSENSFSTYEPEDIKILPLLVQTGYLTIDTMTQNRRTRKFRLKFPNLEIETSFNYWLAESFSEVPEDEFDSTIDRLISALNENRIDDMIEHLKLFFSQIPNTISIRNEKYYQTIFFAVFKLMGAEIDVEVSTNIGRIDAVVKIADNIYIFEFKLYGTAEEALTQIKERKYAAPYLDDKRPITLIGVAFGEEERNITNWIIEPPHAGS